MKHGGIEAEGAWCVCKGGVARDEEYWKLRRWMASWDMLMKWCRYDHTVHPDNP